jgi:hypothetical protein
MQRSCGYVIDVSSQLTQPSTRSAQTSAASSPQRGATLGLEAQSTAVFAVAFLIGLGALAISMPLIASVALLAVAVAIITRALAVLALDPSGPQFARPRELANWDGAFAAALGVLALVFVVTFATGAACVAALGAIGVASLRLRTRYVNA